MDRTAETPAILAFGRFRLFPVRRELFAVDRPIKLGGRAFDVLMALIEARGAVISVDAIMARVWPGQTVEESALQSQISALRAALGADRNLIRTVVGRGYQFVGEIRVAPADSEGEASAVVEGPADPGTGSAREAQRQTNLPEPASVLIGRDDALVDVLNLVGAHRLVTLTGSRGIGKSRLALAAGRQLLPQFADGVWLVDFSPLVDPALAPTAIATAVGLDYGAGNVSATRLARALADRELLLVLDTCEHVIAAVAELAEALLGAGPAIRILATSREPLSTEGEWVVPVRPLAVPAIDAMPEDEPLGYGAIRLFVERARASNPRLPLNREVLDQIAVICRRLDGMPLAIEMATARTSMLTVAEISARLDDRLRLLTAARRTALPRHRTLRATLDWSYDLLPDSERVMLRRAAIFAGSFSLDAASAVAAVSSSPAPWAVIEALSMLVAKSLIVQLPGDESSRFRLLDTTRAYALEKLAETNERDGCARRHAEYYRDLFGRAGAQGEGLPTREWLVKYKPDLDDLRAALDWAFSPNSDARIGIALTVAAIPLWMHLSLLEECRVRVIRALSAAPDDVHEMKLNAALGATLMYSRTVVDPEVSEVWTRTLDQAERLGDVDYQLRALLGVWSSQMRSGHYGVALELTQRFCRLAAEGADPNDALIGEQLTGEVEYLGGNLVGARQHMERMLAGYDASTRWSQIIRFQVDHFSRARAVLARTLWLQGFPAQGASAAESSVESAKASRHAMSLCYVLAQAACPVALWIGDLDAAERSIAMLLDVSRGHALPLWEGWGLYYRGIFLVDLGEFGKGIDLLRAGLNALGEARFAARFITFSSHAALAFGRAGQVAAGLAEVDEALLRFPDFDEDWLLADVLRAKGELLLLQEGPAAATLVEECFREAIYRASGRGALSWEVRAATSLARLLRDQGRLADAHAVLQPVYDRLTEGFDHSDGRAASRLLRELTS